MIFFGVPEDMVNLRYYNKHLNPYDDFYHKVSVKSRRLIFPSCLLYELSNGTLYGNKNRPLGEMAIIYFDDIKRSYVVTYHKTINSLDMLKKYIIESGVCLDN